MPRKLKRLAEEVEAHLIEGAELATATTSAETNVAMAALGAIEGPPQPKDPSPRPSPRKRGEGEVEDEPGRKRGKPRPKAR